MFSFFEVQPAPALRPFVHSIWGVHGSASFRREVVLPNGVVELMINFGPRQKVHAYGDVVVDQDFMRAWVAGVQDQPLAIGSPDGCDHVSVRFRPGGAHAFLDLPLHTLTNQVVDLDQLIGREAATLRDALGAVSSAAARVQRLEAWLLQRMRSVHPYYGLVEQAVALARAADFRMGVSQLCDRFGLSNRHLIEQFRHMVGLTPKVLLRVERFHAVINHVRVTDTADWARTAHRLGYADQSHLIREFRRFAGVTPTEFIRRRTPDGHHVIGD